MSGSEDLFEERKPARSDGEEFPLDRKSQDDSHADEVAVHGGESKYFEGASSFIDLPEAVYLDEPPQNDEKTDAVVLKAGEMLDSLVPPDDQIRLSEGVGQPVDLDSIRIQLDPPAEKIDLNQLLEKARSQFKNGDYATCLKTLSVGLREDPENYHLSILQKEAQRNFELRRAEEELANQIESVKNEAVNLFQGGQFDECVEKFKFLCKLEPDNREFRDFLQTSEEQVSKKR